MAQPKIQQEPTMEEILASIRRIIDSGEGTSVGDADVRAVSGAPPEASNNHNQYHSDDQQNFTDTENFDSQDDSSVNEVQHDEWAPPQRLRESVIFSRTHGNDTATQNIRERDDVHDATKPPVEMHRAVPETPQGIYPGSIGEVARQVRAATDSASNIDDVIDTLISSDSEKRIGDALRDLSSALQQEGGRSIEEIVVEEVRPLLSEWLDEHMPSIVEKMVAKEIERIRTAKH